MPESETPSPRRYDHTWQVNNPPPPPPPSRKENLLFRLLLTGDEATIAQRLREDVLPQYKAA